MRGTGGWSSERCGAARRGSNGPQDCRKNVIKLLLLLGSGRDTHLAGDPLPEGVNLRKGRRNSSEPLRGCGAQQHRALHPAAGELGSSPSPGAPQGQLRPREPAGEPARLARAPGRSSRAREGAGNREPSSARSGRRGSAAPREAIGAAAEKPRPHPRSGGTVCVALRGEAQTGRAASQPTAGPQRRRGLSRRGGSHLELHLRVHLEQRGHGGGSGWVRVAPGLAVPAGPPAPPPPPLLPHTHTHTGPAPPPPEVTSRRAPANAARPPRDSPRTRRRVLAASHTHSALNRRYKQRRSLFYQRWG